MAEKEDESDMTSGAEESDCYSGAQLPAGLELTCGENPVVSPHVSENKHGANGHCEELSVRDAAETPVISEYLHGTAQEGTVLGKSCQVVSPFTGDGLLTERNIITSFVETPGVETVTTTDFSAVTSEVVESAPSTMTIIYVQPDGSFVEGTGLTAEEQQQLVEQLAKQQLVEVSENEAARIFEQQRQPFFLGGALAPNALQQVIEQVAKSQQSVTHAEVHNVTPPVQRKEPEQTAPEPPPTCISLQPGCLLAAGAQLDAAVRSQPLTIVQNASQQLQNVAKQVALQQSQSQNGTRLIQKQLETIRIQVQVPKERPMPPRVVLQQKATAVPAQPRVSVQPGGVSIANPQIIGAQQQYVLHNPGDPPIQLLLQRSTPGGNTFIPLLQRLPTLTPVNGKAVRPAPAPPPAPPTEKKERQREKNRVKRPQRIKTRSGRVSRPPKHKVKDYKFIKREDLVDGHPSDSDDYSEISEEEEDGEESKNSLAMTNFYLNSKAFKCKSCDKAYVGHGGLSRHYRLNPTHGEQGTEPLPGAPAESTDPSAPQTADRTSTSTSQTLPNPAQAVPTATSAAAPQLTAGGQKADPDPTCTAPALPSGPGRPKGPGRPGRPRAAGHPARRGRPGRPPKNPGAASLEQQAQRRRARLKEVLQQCDDEELMEMVLPRLARVVTLWEFLLMKVEKGRPSRPQFSDVYREFEQLHTQVKKMAHEHFSAPHGPASVTELDTREPQVFQSLGLEDLMTKSKTLRSDPSLQKAADVVQHTLLTKRVGQREDCKTLPPAKRFKLENATGETNGIELSQNGSKVAEGGHLLMEPSRGGVDLGLSEAQAPVLTGEVLVKSQAPPLAPPVQLELHPQPQMVFTALERDITPEELVQEHLSNSTERAEPTEVMTVDGEGPGSNYGLLETTQESRGAAEEPAEVMNDSDIADQMQQLEQALSTDAVPLEHSDRTNSQQPVEAVNSGLEQALSLGGAVEFQLAESSQGEGQEQIFIQTEDGLIVHQATSERIVIVTAPDGTTMHIRAPEGVPLETVHALLGIETEGSHTEGMLVAETHP
ncbi:uncharacterized protein znf839 isoform X1 [Megalops cyprinoides]|uniref:uncharacterized protein znf839 isoform X1 n=1 Tax=Megalops cyprinoides TaxID=118141 RepID=UPI0018642651|nr:uncharacterized protein znf839 isoform X1 [Megalops cyprinoides]